MLYRIVKPIGAIIFKLLFFVRAIGQKNVPESGGCVIASNHMSQLDPFFIGMSIKRRVYFMAKSELFKNKFMGWFLSSLGAFPVHRGKRDIAAVKTSIDILEQGNLMGIFPQGKRVTPEMANVRNKTGVALIALRSGCQVVPVFVGTKRQKLRLFQRVTVVFGEPIEITRSGEGDEAENLKQITEKIMSAADALAKRI